jgi:hypothetical protein
MKYLITLLALAAFTLGCKKENNDTQTSLNETPPPATGTTTVKTGTFTTNSKNTGGTIKVIKDANNKQTLVFENFSTGSGPDVQVWLSPNTSASSYVNLGALKAFSGNFSYDLPTTANIDVNNKVLIWCEDFSVLFGHATLQ